jgi:hypothetical protein
MIAQIQFKTAIYLLLGLFAHFAHGAFSVNNFASLPGNSHPNIRSCLWTITQAFGGWGTRNVNVGQGTHIRWGQKNKCVLEVSNPGNAVFVNTGGRMVKGFVETLMSAASSSPVC